LKTCTSTLAVTTRNSENVRLEHPGCDGRSKQRDAKRERVGIRRSTYPNMGGHGKRQYKPWSAPHQRSSKRMEIVAPAKR
jgi:hypothetical protein